MKDENEHVREVYAHYGLAMYLAQCLEKSICILLSVETTNPKTMTKNDYDRIVKDYLTKTFGTTLKKLNKIIEIPDKLEEILKKSVEKRNWLAHNYFWDRASHFNREDGKNYMIKELLEMIDFFEKLDNKISEINTNWIHKLGISEEWIEEQMKENIKNLPIA